MTLSKTGNLFLSQSGSSETRVILNEVKDLSFIRNESDEPLGAPQRPRNALNGTRDLFIFWNGESEKQVILNEVKDLSSSLL